MEASQSPKAKCLFRATIGVSHHTSQKNRKRIHFNRATGRRFIGTDSRTKAAKEILLLQLQSRARAYGIVEPIRTRVRCLLFFGFPPDVFYTSKSKRLVERKTLGDCTNLAQGVEDLLEKSGIVENDRLLAPITIDRVCTETHQVIIELYGHE